MAIRVTHSPVGLIAALAASTGQNQATLRRNASRDAINAELIRTAGVTDFSQHQRAGAIAAAANRGVSLGEDTQGKGVTTFKGQSIDEDNAFRTRQEIRTGQETEAGRAIRASNHLSQEEKVVAVQQVSRKERVDPNAGKSPQELKVEFDRSIADAIYTDDNDVPWTIGKDGSPVPHKMPEKDGGAQFNKKEFVSKQKEMFKELRDAATATAQANSDFEFDVNTVQPPTPAQVRERMEDEEAAFQEANQDPELLNKMIAFAGKNHDLARQLGVDIQAPEQAPHGTITDAGVTEATPELEPLNINGVETSAQDVDDFFFGNLTGSDIVDPRPGRKKKSKGKATPAPLASPAAIADIERMPEAAQNKLEAQLRTAKTDDERRKIITRSRLEQFQASLPDDDPLKDRLSPIVEGGKSILKNFGKGIEAPQGIKDIADRRRGRKEKENTVFDTGRTRAERVAEPEDLTDLWSAVYQTSRDPKKEARARKALKNFKGTVPRGANIAIDTAVEIFGEDKGMTPGVLRRTLRETSIIESGFKTRVQKGGGPARGYAQVEPATAKSLAVNSSAIFGKRMEQFFPGAVERMKTASPQEISKMLENDERLAMTMAAATYMADNAVRASLTGLGRSTHATKR